MTWARHHSASEVLASAAEAATKSGNILQAQELYLSAAEAEHRALSEIESTKVRTLGVTAVSTAALYYKAKQFDSALTIIKMWRNQPALPPFAVSQLDEIYKRIGEEVGAGAQHNVSSLHSAPASMPQASRDLKFDLVCFSQHRWNSTYQATDNVFSYAARERRVFFVEQPIPDDGSLRLEKHETDSNVMVVIPRMPSALRSEIAIKAVLKELTGQLLLDENIDAYVFWYDTPTALAFTDRFRPMLTVFEIQNSPPTPAPKDPRLDEELIRLADLILTDDQNTYDIKRSVHRSVYMFPNGIHVAPPVAWFYILDLIHKKDDKRQLPSLTPERLIRVQKTYET